MQRKDSSMSTLNKPPTSKRGTLAGHLVLGLVCLLAPKAARAEILTAGPLKFDMQVIDAKFRSEGVAIVDVDKDGTMDVMVGDYWYKGPAWTRYEIRAPGDYAVTSYSEAMNVWAEDFDGDGYVDELVVPFPGNPVKWYTNPKGGTGRWAEHMVGLEYYNEQPQFLPIFVGDNKKYLLAGSKADHTFSAYRPGTDPNAAWTQTKISSSNAPSVDIFYHGMGVGDLNGDGRMDFIEPQGWYEQSATKTWTYHSKTFNPLGEECAFMYAYDFNADGLNDMLTSSSHGYGLWWFQQGANLTWTKHEIDRSYSELHSMHFEDMDNDGTPDIVVGKRKFAHNGGDAGGQDAAPLYWYKVTKGATPKFERFVIKADGAGVGTDFEIKDYNGDGWKDIGVSNKTGVKWYVQTGVPVMNRLYSFQGADRMKVKSIGFMRGAKGIAAFPGEFGKLVATDGRLLYRPGSNPAGASADQTMNVHLGMASGKYFAIPSK